VVVVASIRQLAEMAATTPRVSRRIRAEKLCTMARCAGASEHNQALCESGVGSGLETATSFRSPLLA